MTEGTESCVPPGFRFHPTDEELVGYYLRKKVASKKIDLDVIKDIDLYRIEPWDLQGKCRIGYEEEKEWYFFSHKDKKYPTGTRTNRATIAGFWKATGRDKAVYDQRSKVIGMRKTLVFYKGRAPNGQKTEWIMHEYRLESQENGPLQEEGWVVCRAFRKRPTGHAKTTEPWDASNFYDESTTVNSLLNQSDSITRNHHHQNFLAQNFLCKREYPTEPDHHNLMMNNFIHSDSFAHLPPLASPSLPLLPASEDKKVTDWRSLDKFVASQLSHVEEHGGSDLGCVLLQNGRDEFWSSFTDRALGISLYSDKSTV